MSIVIKAENISKAYQLGQIGTGTVSRDIERWVAKLRGKEDPFLKIGEANDRATKGTSDIVWSLKDINFEIEQGDAVGIIGRNGAGKSTLLKLLSRVTAPTTGSIKVKGRIASLLEVGTGFHPELTGRENIYLNGAILGMRKKEITRKLEQIIDFSGVERYIDTPVKRYSSGMYVRLAFAVAAHLESEILIVDEVLAVGDAEFQKKCLGKMGEVSKGEGRTILFVSHNMEAIKNLCDQSILLQNGNLVNLGNTNDIVKQYISNKIKLKNNIWTKKNKSIDNPYFDLCSMYLVNEVDEVINGSINISNKIFLIIEGNIELISSALCVGFSLYNEEEQLMYWSYHTDVPQEEWLNVQKGKNKIKVQIPLNILKDGDYDIVSMISLHNQEWLYNPEENSPKITFNLLERDTKSPYWIGKRNGIIAPLLYYKLV